MDLTPADLIERLREGKVYPVERVPTALNGFFRIENLEALREVALRQVAEDVEAQRLVREPRLVRETDRVIGHCRAASRRRAAARARRAAGLLQRIIRRAWRSAQRLAAELDILTVLAPGRRPGAEEADHLEALRRLARCSART